MFEVTYTNVSRLILIISVFYVFYPRRPRNIIGKIFVHLPLLLIPLWNRYDKFFNPEDFIRVDVVFYYPIFAVVAVMYFLRVIRLFGFLGDDFSLSESLTKWGRKFGFLDDETSFFEKGDEVD